MKKIAVVLMFCLVLLSISTAVFILHSYKQVTAEGPLIKAKNVVIPKGSTLRNVASVLHKENVISNELTFIILVKSLGNSRYLKAGEFRFPARVSAEGAMRVIIRGESVARKITIPEGLTSYQIVNLLLETDGLEGDIDQIPSDGSLLPETYHYSLGDTKMSLLNRMMEEMRKAKFELWQTKNKNTYVKSIKQAMILASIIEKETALGKERARISGVFVNRLKRRMRLQTDPTVIYAISNGRGFLEKPLSKRNLRTKHPFNTYTNYGLPPAPICNPGTKAIYAAIHPEKNSYLYFVADGTGGHVFAKNLKQHNINVQKWRKIEKQRKANHK
jgi:UPF0755 protein